MTNDRRGGRGTTTSPMGIPYPIPISSVILGGGSEGRRLTAFGGVMKEARAALKQEDAETADLVHTGEDAEVRGDLLVALDRFEWQVGVTNYVRVKRDVLVEPPSE